MAAASARATRLGGWSGMGAPGVAAASLADAPWDLRLLRAATRWVLVLALLAFLSLALTAALRWGGFGFQRILLEGELSRSSVATIRANALPRLQGNFFTVDLQAARRAFESVPWVRHAEVRRHWPGQLRVRLQEHRAVALWETIDARDRREDRLVGEDGAVFQANPGDVEDEELPVLRGPEGSSVMLWSVFPALSQALAPVGRAAGGHRDAAIRLLQITGKGSWSVELDTGARLELGRGTPAELLARTETFVRTLPQAVAPFNRPVLYADLRHAGGYALRLSGITTVPATPNRPPAPPPRPARTKP